MTGEASAHAQHKFGAVKAKVAKVGQGRFWRMQQAYDIKSQNEKKTVLRKVFSIRKVNKYSLLREKVLDDAWEIDSESIYVQHDKATPISL